MSISELPKNVSDKLRASITITSLEDVIIGLLKNALDASAEKIHITVDCGKGDCVVEDDGHGILPDEFSDNGGLAKPHCESLRKKLPNTAATDLMCRYLEIPQAS